MMDEKRLEQIERLASPTAGAKDKEALSVHARPMVWELTEEVRRLRKWNLKLSQYNIAMGQENSMLKAKLEEIRDLARTGLKPDILNYSDLEWARHINARCARLAVSALDGDA